MSNSKKKVTPEELKDEIPTIKKEYYKFKPKYEKMGRNVVLSLETILDSNNINFLDINYRIKKWKAIKTKLNKKAEEGLIEKNSNYLDQIVDLCGVRVICYYLSDVEIIEDLIKSEFDIKDIDRHEPLDPKIFEYDSNHYIVELSNSWLHHALFRGMNNVKLEIQLRTILMHTWADISHQLFYKKDPEKISEKDIKELSEIKATFNFIDRRFDKFKKEPIKVDNHDEYNGFDLRNDFTKDNFMKFLKLAIFEKEIDEKECSGLHYWIQDFNKIKNVQKIDFYNLKDIIEEYKRAYIIKERNTKKQCTGVKMLERILKKYHPNFSEYNR